MAPHRARKDYKEHLWTAFEKHTLLCLMAKGEHLAARGKRTDDPSKLRKHAYLEVATLLNFACHGNKFDEDIDKRDVAKMIDRLIVEKKAVLGPGGYMERSRAGRITRGLKKMAQKSTRLDYDGSLSEWENGRKAVEVEKLRIANGGAPRDDAENLLHYDGEEDDDSPFPDSIATPRRDFWAQADAAAAAAPTFVKWRGKQAELCSSIEVDDDADDRTSSAVSNGRDSFRKLPSGLSRNEKLQRAAGGSNNLPPKPTVPAPGRGVTASRTGNENVHDRPSGESADLGPNLPPKPPKPSKEPRKGFNLPGDGRSSTARSLHSSGVNVFSNSASSPHKPVTPAGIQIMPLNRASSRDARLAYSLNAEICPATSTQSKLPEPSTKPKCLFREAINPSRRALMEAGTGGLSEEENSETQNTRARLKITNANKEALPFNRLEKN